MGEGESAPDAPDELALNNGIWYAGGQLGGSELDPDTGGSGFSVADGSDPAFKTHAGYAFHRDWSVEIFHADLGEVDLDSDRTSESASIDYAMTGVALLWYPGERNGWLTGNPWRWYLQGGIGSLDTQSRLVVDQNNDTQFHFGAGAEYVFSDRLSARLSAESYDKDAFLFGLGIVIRLGSEVAGAASGE